MNTNYCYIVKDIDRKLSSYFRSILSISEHPYWTPELIATLRGMYDESQNIDVKNGQTNHLWLEDYGDYEEETLGNLNFSSREAEDNYIENFRLSFNTKEEREQIRRLQEEKNDDNITPHRYQEIENELEELRSKAIHKKEAFQKLANTLEEFRKKLIDDQKKEIKAISSNKYKMWQTVNKYFSGKNTIGTKEDFKNFRNQMIKYFIEALDEYVAKYERIKQRPFTREEILKGIAYYDEETGQALVDDDGKIVMEVNANKIFSMVYEKFLIDFHKATENNSIDIQSRQVFKQMLQPEIWAAVVYSAKAYISDLEKLYINPEGNEINADEIKTFREDLDELVLMDNILLIDYEEMEKEGWQKIAESISVYRSLSQEVKKELFYTPLAQVKLDKGQIIYQERKDRFGYTYSGDPVRLSRRLSGIIGNSRNSDVMMKKLLSATLRQEHAGFKYLYDKIDANTRLRTQFWCNFKKNKQLYNQIQFDRGIIKSFILNKTKAETAISSYFYNLKNNPSNKSFAYIAKQRWTEKAKEDFREAFGPFSRKGGNQYSDNHILKETDSFKQLQSLINVFEALNIDASPDNIVQLLYPKNKSKFLKIVSLLEGLYKYGGIKDGNFSTDFYNWLSQKNINGQRENQEKIKRIITILEEIAVGTSYEQSIRTVNSKGQKVTMYSDVTPGFMGDMIAAINDFAAPELNTTIAEQEANSEAFKKWLKDTYFKSGLYCDFDAQGNPTHIYNFLLRTLWDEANISFRDLNGEYKSNEELGPILENSMFSENSLTRNLGYIRTIAGKSKGKIIPFENFTRQQHLQSAISQYFAFARESNKSCSDWGYTPVFVLGTSGVSKALRTKVFSEYKDYNSEKINGISIGSYNPKRVVDELYQLFESEKQRQFLFNEAVKDMRSKGYVVNKNMAKLVTSETVSYEGKTVPKINFTIMPFLTGYKDESGKPIELMNQTEVKKVIRENLEKKFDTFLKTEVNKKESWVKGIEKALNLDGDFRMKDNQKKKMYRIEGKTKSGGNSFMYVSMEERLRDYYYNNYLAFALQYQMFTVDTGFYKSSKEFQKRYQEQHAPGDVCDVNAIDRVTGKRVLPINNQNQTAVFFKDLLMNGEESSPALMRVIFKTYALEQGRTEEEISKALNEGILIPRDNATEEKARQAKLRKFLGTDDYIRYSKYNKGTRTDGQALRSLESYRKILIMRGLDTPANLALLNKIKQINESVVREHRNITNEELAYIEAFQEVLMPLKPYWFGFEDYSFKYDDKKGNTLDLSLPIPVQCKNSETLIVPCLYPVDSDMRQVAEWMDSEHIDVIMSDECVKVGAYGQADLEEKDANGVVNIKDNLNKSSVVRHSLPWKYYRIQNNVPNSILEHRGVGTQLKKIILGGINAAKQYDYFGKNKKIAITKGDKLSQTGHNLVALYNSLIMANTIYSYRKFSRTILKNNQTLSSALSKMIINSSRMSLNRLAEIAINDKGELAVPINEGSIEYDIIAMLNGAYRKEVNKHSMFGGSAVQLSDWGVKVKDIGITSKVEASQEDTERPLQFIVDKDGRNVLYAEIEIPFDFSYVNSAGKTVKLKREDYCNPDGTFIKTKDGRNKIEVDFPGILDIVAYRIPSERAYSLLNCKVVRCSPLTQGGTIRVPALGTVIAGFDFDIDKLYFIRKEFRMNLIEEEFSDEEKTIIFNRIYEDYPEIEEELQRIREESGEWHYIYVPDKEGGTKGIKKYDHHLNYYWDKMMAENVSWQEDEVYDKNRLFSEAAEELSEELSDNPEEAEAGKTKLTLPEKYEIIDEYNLDKPVLENSPVARNNMLLEFIKSRLMDEETLPSRLTPGSFEAAKGAAGSMRYLKFAESLDDITTNGVIDIVKLTEVGIKIREEEIPDPEPNYDLNDVSTLLYYNQLSQVAAKLIGIFANQNTNHQFSSIIKSLSVTTPIIFGDMLPSNGKHVEILKSFEQDRTNGAGTTLLAKKIRLPNGIEVDIDLNLAEYLAASVDAVKEPVLNYLNFNTTTAAAGCLLARLGYNSLNIGLLFNQPIIMDICEAIQDSGGILSFEKAKRKVLSEYLKDNKRVDYGRYNEIQNTNISSSDLATAIANYKKESDKGNTSEETLNSLKNESINDKTFLDIQLKALKVFEQAYNSAKPLNKFIKKTKFTAANAVGTTTGFFYNQIEDASQVATGDYNINMVLWESGDDTSTSKVRFDNALDVESDPTLINKPEEYLTKFRDDPFAFEQCMFDANRLLLKEVNEKFLPYETDVYAKAREAVSKLLQGDKILSEEQNNNIHHERTQQMLACNESSIFNPNGIHHIDNNGEAVTNREYYLYRFPEELFSYINKSHPLSLVRDLVKYITPYSYTLKDHNITNGINSNTATGIRLKYEEESRLVDDFMDLLSALATSDMEVEKEIAKSIFMHNYYKAGYSKTAFTFIQKIPVEVKELLQVDDNMSYLDYLRRNNLEQLSSHESLDFAYMYALNHPEDYTLIQNIDSYNKEENARIDKLFTGENGTLKKIIPVMPDNTSEVEKSSWFGVKINQDDEGNIISYSAYPIVTKEVTIFTEIEGGKTKSKTVQAVYVASLSNDLTDSYSYGAEVQPGGTIYYHLVSFLGKKNVYNTYADNLCNALMLSNEKSSNSQNYLQTISETVQQTEETQDSEIIEEENDEEYYEYVEADNSSDNVVEDSQAQMDDNGMNDDVMPTDDDISKLQEKLQRCNVATEEWLFNAISRLLEEHGLAPNISKARVSVIKSILERKADSEGKQLRDLIIDQVVQEIKSNIRNGKKEVYTSLTKELIC